MDTDWITLLCAAALAFSVMNYVLLDGTDLGVGMLMGLTTALKEGDSFPVTLIFEKAGEVTMNVDVLSLRAEGPDCADAGQ